MKKSSRRPSRRIARAIPLNEVGGVVDRTYIKREARTGQFVAKKVEGQEMLSKVKEYQAVTIKGYRYAF